MMKEPSEGDDQEDHHRKVWNRISRIEEKSDNRIEKVKGKMEGENW